MKQSWTTRRGWILLAAGLGAVGIFLVTVGQGSTDGSHVGKDDSVTHQTPSDESQPAWSKIYASRYEACDVILASNSEPVSDETADADREHLAEEWLRSGPPDGDVRSVGPSHCGNLPVVIVGVKHGSVKVPAYGPGGTPVMAYRQREAVAF